MTRQQLATVLATLKSSLLVFVRAIDNGKSLLFILFVLTTLVFIFPILDTSSLRGLSSSMRRIRHPDMTATFKTHPTPEIDGNAFVFAGMTFAFALAFLYSRELWRGEAIKKNELYRQIFAGNDAVLNANQKVTATEAELRKAHEVTDKLFSVISHDLRSPLTSLKGILHLSEQGHISKDEEVIHYKKLQSNVDSSLGLLNNLLFWATTQMNSMTPLYTEVKIRDIVDENLRMHDWIIQQKNLSISNLVSDVHFVYADRGMVSTIVSNLLSNAVKFTQLHGAIRFESEVARGKVNFRVIDNGTGMTDDIQANVFKNNVAKSVSGTLKEPGAGIGLFLCKQLCDLNDADISVKSIPAVGTAFTVEFRQIPVL